MDFSRKGAKTQRQTCGTKRSVFAPLRLCGRNFLVALLAFASPLAVHSQRKGLIPLHPPDLSTLEESVREQVAAAQTATAAAIRDQSISDSALSEAYGKLGEIYHAYSLISSARDCYLNASKVAPRDFRWHHLLANLDHQQGRIEDAIRRYLLVRTLRPDYVAAPVNLANIYLDLNRLEEAEESFKAALEIDKDNSAAHYGLGQVALSRRSYAEAVDHFEKTLAQVPGANRVHYSLAMAYRGLRNAEKAKVHLSQQGPVGVRVADPLVDGLQDLIEGERLHLSRGKLAFESRRYAEAVVEFRKAVAAKPDSVTARINLGAALSQVNDLKGAAEQFQEAIRLDPARVNAHYNLAILLAGENKHGEAIGHLQYVLKVEPNDVNARFLLARELKNSGRVDEALVELSRVVQAAPGNEEALLEEVKLLQQKARFKEAIDALEKGHAQYPQKGRTVIVLAYLLATSPLLELRNGGRALELAQRVYNETGAVQHGALVAMALAELGRCSEAAEWQRRMIAAARQQNNTDVLAKLSASLKIYEVQPCRPVGDASLKDLPF